MLDLHKPAPTTAHRLPLPRQWRHRFVVWSLAIRERAHILSRPLAIAHVRTHLAMVGYGLRHRIKIMPFALLIVLLLAVGCGTDRVPSASPVITSSSTSALPPMRPSGTLDELVSVGDGRLHVRCVGAGPATVVLISGFNDGGDSWGEIEPALSQQARVCSYARFGTGTSDAPTRTQTFATSSTDLHALLAAIGEPGPYVVVGHSYGGGQAVTFASQYRSEVDGLVLLDATPPGWFAAGCAVPDDGSEWAAWFRDACRDRTDPNDNPEWLDEIASFEAVSTIETLDELPLAVVTAADHPFPGLAPRAAARLNEVWDHGQQDWLSLSSDARLVSVEDTGHYIQLDRPDVTLTQIEGLLP